DAALAAVDELLGRWVEARRESVLEEFRARDALRGRDLRWEGAGGAADSGAGVAEGIDERGNLAVVTRGGDRLTLGAGEVKLVVPDP
ncbi:MAG TPA: hypothetical protein VE997_05960, partial [Candidatus Limnocylindria bacterium]|nr:hypothetical protein [Candidatus Limnocylindria bacterium]